MNLKQRFVKWAYGYEPSQFGMTDFKLPTIVYDKDNPSAVSVATSCVKILAETIGKMPVHVWEEKRGKGQQKDKNSILFKVLGRQPNEYTNANSFFQTLEYHRNYKGNSFARIHRNGAADATSLEIVSPSRVKGYKVAKGDLFYEIYISDNETEMVNHMELLHFRMMSPDGIWGINPIASLTMNLGVMFKGLGSMDKFYENNALSPKALKTTVGGANVARAKEAMTDFNKEYGGMNNAGKWINLPPNTDIVDLQISLADAQIIESLKFNGQQIAALFGVPVYMATGDFTQSKYNNIEQSQLSFKVNTISSITKMYEAELEMKLLTDKQKTTKKIRFNINSLVEPDTRTKSEYYRSLANIGAITPYTIAEFENLPLSDIQKTHLVMTNLQPLEKTLKPKEL